MRFTWPTDVRIRAAIFEDNRKTVAGGGGDAFGLLLLLEADLVLIVLLGLVPETHGEMTADGGGRTSLEGRSGQATDVIARVCSNSFACSARLVSLTPIFVYPL